MANARVTWHGAAEAANREVETVAKAVADAGAKAVWSGGRCGVGQRRRRGQAGGGRRQAMAAAAEKAGGGGFGPRWPCVGGNFFRLEFQFF